LGKKKDAEVLQKGKQTRRMKESDEKPLRKSSRGGKEQRIHRTMCENKKRGKPRKKDTGKPLGGMWRGPKSTRNKERLWRGGD